MLKALGSLFFFGLAAVLLRKCMAEFRAMADGRDGTGDGLVPALYFWMAFWFAFLGFCLLVEVTVHG